MWQLLQAEGLSIEDGEMNSRIAITVELEIPLNTYTEDIKNYVVDAVKSHAGGLAPEEPMFNINRESVRISCIEFPQ